MNDEKLTRLGRLWKRLTSVFRSSTIKDPKLTKAWKTPSDAERRDALEHLHKWMTLEMVADIHQDYIHKRRDSERTIKFHALLDTIQDPGMTQDDLDESSRIIVGAVRREDIEMLGYLFNERHKMGSELYNERFDAKLADVAFGRAKPPIKLVS